MFYNRMENYRHSFGKPPEICVKTWASGKAQSCVNGLLMNISVRGAKIFSEKELPNAPEPLRFVFKIAQETIKTEGTLVWKSEVPAGWVYGVEWFKNPVQEMLIAEEIKSRTGTA